MDAEEQFIDKRMSTKHSVVSKFQKLIINANNLPNKKQASGMSKRIPLEFIFAFVYKFVVFLSITKTITATT